jgi:hypothetical protein
MNAEFRISELRIGELLALIGGNEITPGSGVAGAVALALAASCASKAVTISLKHHPDSAVLHAALATFRSIAATALADGERDSQAFKAVVHKRDSASVGRLTCEGEQFSKLIASFVAAIDGVQPSVQLNMRGDISAARALASAAQKIQISNEEELTAHH